MKGFVAPNFGSQITRTNRQLSNTCSLPFKSPARKGRFSVVAVAAQDSGTQDEIQSMMLKLQQLRAKRDQLTKESASKSKPGPEPVVAPEDLDFGRHGQGSRFISFSTIDAADYFPRIVPLLRSPISPAEFTDCPRIDVGGGGVREKGRMYFAKLPPKHSAALECFALPLAGKLIDLVDPVALAVDPDTIAPSLSVDRGSNVVLVVERDLSGAEDEEFDPYKFYLWGIGDILKIGWLKSKPTNVQCLGRVVVALKEEKEERRQAKSCWEEENDAF